MTPNHEVQQFHNALELQWDSLCDELHKLQRQPEAERDDDRIEAINEDMTNLAEWLHACELTLGKETANATD